VSAPPARAGGLRQEGRQQTERDAWVANKSSSNSYVTATTSYSPRRWRGVVRRVDRRDETHALMFYTIAALWKGEELRCARSKNFRAVTAPTRRRRQAELCTHNLGKPAPGACASAAVPGDGASRACICNSSFGACACACAGACVCDAVGLGWAAKLNCWGDGDTRRNGCGRC